MSFTEDTFTDVDGTALTDHVGELGAAWTAHMAGAGAPPVISDTNELRRGGAADSTVCYASGVPDDADYSVTADFRYIASGLNCWAGIFARLATGSYDGYLLQYEQWMGDRAWVLYSVVAGAYTNLQSAAAPAPGTAVLRVEGDAITVVVDGTPTLAVTNSDHADAGRVGVRFDPGGDGADSIWLDNLVATSLVPTIAPAGIGSGESVGEPTLTGGALHIRPGGIPTAETFDGIALLSTSTPTIAPAGIPSAATLGAPELADGGPTIIAPAAIPAAATTGEPFILNDEIPFTAPRERFVDRLTGEVYPWPVNHATEDSVKALGRRLNRGGISATGLLVRQPSHPGPVHLGLRGAMIDREREQYQRFVQFFNECDDRALDYIDAAGESYKVIITQFDAHRKISPARVDGSYFEYSLEVEVLEVNSGALKGYL